MINHRKRLPALPTSQRPRYQEAFEVKIQFGSNILLLSRLIELLQVVVLALLVVVGIVLVQTGPKTLKQTRGGTNNNQKFDIYWNNSCPLEERRFSIRSREDEWLHDPQYRAKEWADTYESFTLRAEHARNFSLQSGAMDVVRDAVTSGSFKDRNIVIVGDSIQREVFISLGCLAQEEIESHAIRWENDQPNGRYAHNEGRMRWKSGGDLFFSPRAGRMFEYANWTDQRVPYEQPDELSWLESCRKREPFGFMAYSLPDMDEVSVRDEKRRTSSGDEDDGFEKIMLKKNDVVMMNGSVHKSRIENLAALTSLLDCMDEARKEGTDNADWPTITYSKSTYLYSEWRGGPRCGVNTNLRLQNEELELFGSRLDIIGKSMNYTGKSDLHVWGEKTDCVHWLLPGLPDLLAAELTYKTLSTVDSNSAIILDELPKISQEVW